MVFSSRLKDTCVLSRLRFAAGQGCVMCVFARSKADGYAVLAGFLFFCALSRSIIELRARKQPHRLIGAPTNTRSARQTRESFAPKACVGMNYLRHRFLLFKLLPTFPVHPACAANRITAKYHQYKEFCTGPIVKQDQECDGRLRVIGRGETTLEFWQSSVPMYHAIGEGSESQRELGGARQERERERKRDWGRWGECFFSAFSPCVLRSMHYLICELCLSLYMAMAVDA